jgi:hypothetical protein
MEGREMSGEETRSGKVADATGQVTLSFGTILVNHHPCS